VRALSPLLGIAMMISIYKRASIHAPVFQHVDDIIRTKHPFLKIHLCAPFLLLSVVSLANSAFAQNQPAAPSQTPPTLERLEEGQQPGVTIRQQEGNKGTADTRDPSGAVTETKVKTGSSTYYVRPNRPAGSAQAGDLQSSGNRAAQFQVKQFDLGRKKEHKPGDTPQTTEPVAPPPPSIIPVKN
jgi:hypothetical protein